MKLTSLIVYITCMSTFSFGAPDDFKWPTYEKQEIPDSLRDENAIYFQNVTTVDYNAEGETTYIIFKRLGVNSKASADELSKQTFYVNSSGQLNKLHGRIIKSNGQVIELEDIDKYKTKITEKNKYESTTYVKYQVLFPNVVEGDVIDLYYEITLDHYIYSSIFYLEDDFKSLYSRLSIRNYSAMDINAVVINQEIQPQTRVIDGIPTLNWERQNVDMMLNGYFNAPNPSFPCLVFNLWKSSDRYPSLDYKLVHDLDENQYPENFNKSDRLTNQLIQAGVFVESDVVGVKVQKAIKYFESDFTWVEDLRLEIQTKASTYYKNKQINEELFFYYINKLINEAGSVYYRCYTKSLLDGVFIHGLVAFEQLDLRFLMFLDENQAEHFIFAPRGRDVYYYLDEIPFYAEGNESIGLFGENRTLKEISQVRMPTSSNVDNMHLAKFVLKVSSDSVNMLRQDDFSGHFSTLLRGRVEGSWLKDFLVSDTIIKPAEVLEYYPFNRKYKQEKLVLLERNELDDTLSFISFMQFMPKSFFYDDELNEKAGGFMVLPFVKSERFSFFVSGDNKIELAEKYGDEINNSVGSVVISTARISENMIKINYEIKIEKRTLNNYQEVGEYISLLKFWDNAISKKWLLNCQ